MAGVKVQVGEVTTFAKTVGESDIYLFAGITGDFAPNHINQAFMARSRFGRIQAHGALIVGFMSTVAGMVAIRTSAPPEIAVSVGYDRIRFTAPVFVGDTITVTYRIVGVEEARRRATADIEVTKEDGTLVAVARHILGWIDEAG